MGWPRQGLVERMREDGHLDVLGESGTRWVGRAEDAVVVERLFPETEAWVRERT